MDHILSVQSHHYQNEIETCSVEIAQYLANLSNWDQPLFPDVQDCSAMLVDPDYFDVNGTWWNCDNQIAGEFQ